MFPLWRAVRELLTGFAELGWPAQCLMCQTPCAEGFFCPTCRPQLTTDNSNLCPRCASTVGAYSAKCLRCEKEKYAFVGATRLGSYDGLLRDAVLQMKTFPGVILAGRLGELWADVRRQALIHDAPDVIIPVPLHWRRYWSRGYNQAEELARGVGRVLNLPVWPGCLRRLRPTAMQASLSATTRRENLKGAFVVRRGFRMTGLRVLLIDDVLTTGATCHAASVALREAGAAQVRVAVVAHR
jgi:ComF family protein